MPTATIKTPQAELYINQLDKRLKTALGIARRGNKAKALKIAEEALTFYFQRLLDYTWNTRVKRQIRNPKQLTPAQIETFRKKIVANKLKSFNEILNDL